MGGDLSAQTSNWFRRRAGSCPQAADEEEKEASPCGTLPITATSLLRLY